MGGVQEPKIHCVFLPSTQTWCYVVADKSSGHAVVIDPAISREPSKPINTTASDAILTLIEVNNYTIAHVLETNAYIQHPSAAWYLRAQLLDSTGQAPRIAVRQSLKVVQRLYARKNGVRNKFWAGEFDGKFVDGEVLTAGDLRIQVVHLPGLSGRHVGYVIGGHIFTGDCCLHTLDQSVLPRVIRENLEMSKRRLQNMPRGLRISTTRGCPAKPKGSSGCLMEVREQHEAGYDIPWTGAAEALDRGLIS